MTSIGILGTFVGIFIGLLDFDILNINSVTTLLEGLKVAFGTSIIGLLGAVLFRIISPIISRVSVNNEEATAKDIVDRLMQIDSSINKATEENGAGFEELRNALTDDKDSSIVGQLQRLRASVGDLEGTTRRGFEEQIKEFKDFAKHMSEAFSKAIIEELQTVIREFNETLSEQFGENFKQLNVAVGRLVAWQEEYRQQMSDLKVALDNAVEGIQASEKALGEIEQSSSKIPDHMSSMQQANSNLNAQIETMSKHLGGFAEMREKAVNAFPEIEKNIENITSNLSSTVERQSDAIKEAVKEIAISLQSLMGLQKESVEKLQQGFEELRSTTSDTVLSLQSDVAKITNDLSDSVTNTSSGFTKHFESAIEEQKAVQQEMLKGLQTSFNETISNTTSGMNETIVKLNETIVKLDDDIQSEIERVIREMAVNLAGITEKFVKDYTPLLEETRRIVELGERANQDE